MLLKAEIAPSIATKTLSEALSTPSWAIKTLATACVTLTIACVTLSGTTKTLTGASETPSEGLAAVAAASATIYRAMLVCFNSCLPLNWFFDIQTYPLRYKFNIF